MYLRFSLDKVLVQFQLEGKGSTVPKGPHQLSCLFTQYFLYLGLFETPCYSHAIKAHLNLANSTVARLKHGIRKQPMLHDSKLGSFLTQLNLLNKMTFGFTKVQSRSQGHLHPGNEVPPSPTLN